MYSVDVFDDNGCVNSGFFSISGFPSSITVSENITNVSCNGLNDGSINFNISGGITDYTINNGLSQTLTGGVSSFTTPNILSMEHITTLLLILIIVFTLTLLFLQSHLLSLQ